MKLSQLLTPEQVLLGFRAEDKWQAIEAMAATLNRIGGHDERLARAATEALIAREKSMTTGMENGIAIPHAALDELSELLAVVAIAPDGIAFDTIDGAPGRILVALLIPRAEKLLHIRTLAEIAKLLSRAPVRQRLLECKTTAQVLDAVREGETAG